MFGSFPLLEKINVKGFNESVFRRETKSNYCYIIRGVCDTPTKTLKGFFLESKFCFCSELCLCHCRKNYLLMQGLLCRYLDASSSDFQVDCCLPITLPNRQLPIIENNRLVQQRLHKQSDADIDRVANWSKGDRPGLFSLYEENKTNKQLKQTLTELQTGRKRKEEIYFSPAFRKSLP